MTTPTIERIPPAEVEIERDLADSGEAMFKHTLGVLSGCTCDRTVERLRQQGGRVESYVIWARANCPHHGWVA